MLSDNISMLRMLNGYSQEEVATRVGISRQAYAKWEKGESLPDVLRCQKLAALYGTTIDALLNFDAKVGQTALMPAPKGKHIFGTVKLNDHGQVVIPKKARAMFQLQPGDEMVVLGDESEGLAMIRADVFEELLQQLWAQAVTKQEE